MKIFILLLIIFVVGCSSLSQTVETPVVMPKKTFAGGGGAIYSHNLRQNDQDIDNDEVEEFQPNLFLGGRYGFARNWEVAATGGTRGLNDGSGIDLRVRYQYYNGWRYPEEDDHGADSEDSEDGNNGGAAKDGDGPSDASDDDLLADSPPFVANGWTSTASFGVFWSGFNKLEADSTNYYDGGAYLSNSLGYKRNSMVYYFGAKIMQLETEYRYKANRFTSFEDINSKYNELTYGLFAGLTYHWQSKKDGHGYLGDLLFTFNRLPKTVLDRSDQFYPGLTLSFWYTN